MGRKEKEAAEKRMEEATETLAKAMEEAERAKAKLQKFSEAENLLQKLEAAEDQVEGKTVVYFIIITVIIIIFSVVFLSLFILCLCFGLYLPSLRYYFSFVSLVCFLVSFSPCLFASLLLFFYSCCFSSFSHIKLTL